MRYSQNRRTGYKNFMSHVAWLLVMAFGSAEISAGKKRKSAGELSRSLGGEDCIQTRVKKIFRYQSERTIGTWMQNSADLSLKNAIFMLTFPTHSK